MAGILDLMGYIQDQSDKGRQAGLQRLVGKAYGAAPDQQQQILSTVAQRGAPDLAMSADKAFGEQQDNVHLQMAKRAAEVVALYQSNPQMAQQVYQNGLLPIARRAGVPNAPMQLDPSLIPGLEKLASAAGGAGQEMKSLVRGANGNYWAIRDGQFVDTGTPYAPDVAVRDQPGAPFDLVNKRTGQSIYGQPQQSPQEPPPAAAGMPGASVQPGPALDPTQDYPQLASSFPGTQVSSLFRTPEHNAEVGGVPNSQHMRGTAGDFVVPKAEQAQFIAKAKALGYETIQEGDHIHLELPPGRQAAASFGAGQGVAQSGRPPMRPAISPAEQQRLDFARQASERADAASQRADLISQRGTAPAGYRFRQDGSLEPIPGAPKPAASAGAETQKQAVYAKNMAEDAYAFAAAFTGIPAAQLKAMSPEQVRQAMLQHDRTTAGPVLGSLPGMGKFANADLEAYSNSAAGKQARINNPTGPVTNADFEVARKSVFSADKPRKVNADLVYEALVRARQGGQAAPAQPSQPPALPAGFQWEN